MRPGPNYVYKCPNCENLIQVQSLKSGNNIDEVLYSDLKSIAPMLPEFPDLTKCSKCDQIFWLSKLEEEGRYFSKNEVPRNWSEADFAEFLDIKGLQNALTLVDGDNDEERTIRMWILWSFNDRVRNGHKLFNTIQDKLEWSANIEKLMKLLGDDDIDDKIFLAELYRNLGLFDQCISILDSIDSEDANWIKIIYKTQCANKNSEVFKIR